MTDVTTPAGAYRVVVFARPDDPEIFADAIAKPLNLNRVDARIDWHNIPGVLPHHLTLDAASEVAAAIRGLGVNSIVVMESTLPRLDRAEVVHRAACLPEGLEIAGLSGARHALIEWENLVVAAVGYVPLESAQHYNVEPSVVVFSAPHSHTELTETTSINGFELWLVTAHPERVFRIEQDRMNYEYLGERMVESAAANFKVFLADIAAHAKHTYMTPAVHAVLEHKPLGKYRFADAEALKRDTLLHVLLHREQSRVARSV